MITAVISTCCLNFLVNIAIVRPEVPALKSFIHPTYAFQYLVLTTEEIINTPLTLALFFAKVGIYH
jgi:hypothetical protein